MMHTILKRHTMVLTVALVVTLGTVGALVWFAHIVEKRTERVISAKEQLASYDENKKIFAEESKLLAAIGEREAILEQYRIRPETTPELLSQLEDLARATAVEFSIVAVQTPGEGDKQKLLIDIAANGTRSALDAFLKALSHQTYQVRFTRASLFANKDTAATVGTWGVLASLEIVSY